MPNLNQIQREIRDRKGTKTPRTAVRRKYLKLLHKQTQRNVIGYYSSWLSKSSSEEMQITAADMNGFMLCTHGLDRSKGLDLILHTPGGHIAATQSIVEYLREMFDDNIRALVPQTAMSAGTILACSCRSIVMGKQSSLGPIDPHLNGLGAYTVLEEFKQAAKEMVDRNGKINAPKAILWQRIIDQYRPTFITECKHAIDRSKKFLRRQLEEVMFLYQQDRKKRAGKVVKALTQYKDGHDRNYHIKECRKMGLRIEPLEDDQTLQDLVLSVHHCYMLSLTHSRTVKIIENHAGAATAKRLDL